MSINHAQPLLAIASSLVWAIGVLLFLGQLAALAFAGERRAVAFPAE
jgi:uncharacterized membrane protein YgdD (TMEM256/DUF423 family)